MERLRQHVAALLCALLLCTGLPRLQAAACHPSGGSGSAPGCCCGDECPCGRDPTAASCPCSEEPAPAPEAPAPRPPRPPEAPAVPRPEPVLVTAGETAARAAHAAFTPRFGIDARQGRARHLVLSVWLI